jgi:hypothetical protein
VTRLMLAIALALLGLAAEGRTALAQPPPAPQAPPGPPPGFASDVLTSLEVQVVITRLDRGKVVSTMPYTLTVTSNAGEAQLNMGTEVPVPTSTMTPVPPPAAPSAGNTPPGTPPGIAPPQSRPMTSVSYRPVGTVITCRATTRKGDEARYQLTLSVDDSTIFTSGQAVPPMPVGDALPVFRSFRSRNTLMMTDGQTRQYTAASDRVSGEVVRLEVTLRVVK